MERHIHRFLNRLSLLIAAVATLSLLHLLFHTSSCTSSSSSSLSSGPHHHRHPSSTCDPSLSRSLQTPDRRFEKLSSTSSFKKRSHSLSLIFETLRSLHILSNSSHVLVLSAGAGHAAVALHSSGVSEVTSVDIVDFPPFVNRADPHNLPFFDGAFDLAFSDGLDGALFPARFAAEMERTVKKGGAEAVVVEDVEGVERLFRRSSLVEVRNVTLDGSEMSLIVMRNNGNPP